MSSTSSSQFSNQRLNLASAEENSFKTTQVPNSFKVKSPSTTITATKQPPTTLAADDTVKPEIAEIVAGNNENRSSSRLSSAHSIYINSINDDGALAKNGSKVKRSNSAKRDRLTPTATTTISAEDRSSPMSSRSKQSNNTTPRRNSRPISPAPHSVTKTTTASPVKTSTDAASTRPVNNNPQPPAVAFDTTTNEFTYLLTVPRQLVDIHNVQSVIRTTAEAARLKHLLQFVADRYAPLLSHTSPPTHSQSMVNLSNHTSINSLGSSMAQSQQRGSKHDLLYASTNAQQQQQNSNVTVEIAMTEAAIIDKSIYATHERRQPALSQQQANNSNNNNTGGK